MLCVTDVQYVKVITILQLSTCMSSLLSLPQPTPPSRFVAGYVGAVTSAVTIAVSWLYFLLLHLNQFVYDCMVIHIWWVYSILGVQSMPVYITGYEGDEDAVNLIYHNSYIPVTAVKPRRADAALSLLETEAMTTFFPLLRKDRWITPSSTT